MKAESFSYVDGSGWSVPILPDLDSARTLVLVFSAPEFAADHPAFLELRAHFPTSQIAGCSTAGEIIGDSLNDASLSVAVLRFDSTDIRVAFAEVRDASDSYGAAANLAGHLASDDLRGVFVLSDGLNVNGSELVRGLNDELPEGVVVTGGLAGDGSRFGSTFVLRGGRPTTHTICAVGLYGDKVRIGHGSRGGWDKFGHERVVTRSKGNVLYELDGKPALDIYKEYLGERASGLPATGLLFPLAIRACQDDPKPLVRTILAVDDEQNTMTFAGDVPEGSIAQFLYANFDRVIGSAGDAAERAAEPAQEGTVAVAISCVGRRLILCERTEEEIEAALDALPMGSHLVGFYSYGEISPYASGTCDLHNQSMTLTTFSEAA